MKQKNKHCLEKSFPNLNKLASFILEQRLSLFIKTHFKRHSEYDTLPQKDFPAQRRQASLRVFRQSCENWLQKLSTYRDFKSIQESIEEAVEHELLTLGTSDCTIEYITTINFVWSASLKEYIAEYTDNLNVTLEIIKEIDYVIAIANKIAYQRYTKLLTSNFERENKTLQESHENLKKFAEIAIRWLQKN